MATSVTGALNEGKETQVGRGGRGIRKTQTAVVGGETQRFFLAKPGGSGGGPELGKELSGEAEAIVESLKTGLNYFVMSEWRGVADFSGKRPQLAREAARSSPKTG